MVSGGQLWVEVYSVCGDQAEVPVQSAVSLFVWTYLHSPASVSLTLVVSPPAHPSLTVTLVVSPPAHPSLTVTLAGLDYHQVPQASLQSPVSDCCLPVFSLPDGSSCVAGLCAVLRQVVKHSGEEYRSLLGFREGCLFACAEVSLWTKFCEIDVVEVVHEVLSWKVTQDVNISGHIAKFEEHLKQPVRMHNVDKLRKEINRELVNHDFAEGHSMSLADLIIIPCVSVFVQGLDDGSLDRRLPAVIRWYRLVLAQEGVAAALSVIKGVPSLVGGLSNVNYVMPEVPQHSLYKSDPKRYKPKLKQFTRQEDVEAALSVVEELDLNLDYDVVPFGHEMPLDWHSVPSNVQPDVPQSRLARKRQQLENLAKAIIKVAKPGDRIVDFCCGSGHLGIVVAHHLPDCRVVLLDNKEESLARAKGRVQQLGLANVTTVQCNLDYFRGPFQIGVSLHACGVATDLVIHACLQQNAAFVVCPCCYGSLQSNHVVTYPRSTVLAGLSLRHYLVLSHCADQTHQQLYAKSAQGERCMTIVDQDRCHLAQERGYSVSLAKLVPLTCSPKNNLLVGIPHS